MKKFNLLGVFVLAAVCSSPLAAQTKSGYMVDNFDLRSGVRLELPPLPALPAPKKKRAKPDTNPKLVQTTALVMPAAGAYTPPYGMQMAAARTLDGFTTSDANIDSYIVSSAQKHGVDPVLVYALMHQESSFKRNALSYKGASGLMQLMPATARRLGVTNIFDPAQNIEGGIKYLRMLLDMFDGDVALALAGYNAGEGAVMKYGNRVPPYAETQEYVRRITNRYSLMRNPSTARVARKLTPKQAAAVPQKESAPLTIYERTVFAVRLPDGKLQLVSQ